MIEEVIDGMATPVLYSKYTHNLALALQWVRRKVRKTCIVYYTHNKVIFFVSNYQALANPWNWQRHIKKLLYRNMDLHDTLCKYTCMHVLEFYKAFTAFTLTGCEFSESPLEPLGKIKSVSSSLTLMV